MLVARAALVVGVIKFGDDLLLVDEDEEEEEEEGLVFLIEATESTD